MLQVQLLKLLPAHSARALKLKIPQIPFQNILINLIINPQRRTNPLNHREQLTPPDIPQPLRVHIPENVISNIQILFIKILKTVRHIKQGPLGRVLLRLGVVLGGFDVEVAAGEIA